MDRYVELAKLAQSAFDERRRIEWRVNLGLWAALGAITYFARKERIQVFQPEWLAWVFAIGIFVSYVIYIFHFLAAHTTDKAWKHYYMARAEGEKADRPARGTWVFRGFPWWWLIMQLIFTGMLLYVVTMILTAVKNR